MRSNPQFMTIRPTRRPALAVSVLAFGAMLSGVAGAISPQDLQPSREATMTLTPAQEAAGWKVLFDGTDTSAFRGYRNDDFPEQGWSINDDGTLQVHADGGGGDIITRQKFEDFELMLEWKVSRGANSGIMYRVTEEHTTPWQTGPEYQILDDASYNMPATSSHTSGGLYDLTDTAEDKVVKPTGAWNTTRIRMKDGVVEHWLNGKLLVRENLDSEAFAAKVANSKFNSYEGFGIRKEGHLALQDHGNDVWFRNVLVRDLNARLPNEVPLFKDGRFSAVTGHFPDGSIHDAWQIDGAILKTPGRPIGYIRTVDDFTNYVLKLEWRFNPVTKEEGNGGVLLRMIGEDKVWPKSIEAQLMSRNAGDFWNIDNFEMSVASDRTSGRNTKKTHLAEHAVGSWNEYEIIVDRSEVILKVNGQVVNRAWDVAEVPGKICLQSEGAEIHFRNVRLAPIQYEAR